MKKLILLIFTLSQILFSCNEKNNIELTKNWKVNKMEKAVNIMSNSHTYININTTPSMSYHFMPNNKINITTAYGSDIGNWKRNDSLITINAKGETKKFKIVSLTDENLIITSGRFKFHLLNH